MIKKDLQLMIKYKDCKILSLMKVTQIYFKATVVLFAHFKLMSQLSAQNVKWQSCAHPARMDGKKKKEVVSHVLVVDILLKLDILIKKKMN